MILPAPPGSGKSTLCAGLAFSGWRLLSDELTLIEPNTGAVVPVPRPISLKNASIDVLRAFAPGATIGPAVHETIKGSVAHVKPPVEGVLRAKETAKPRWVVLPRYAAGAEAHLEPLSKGAAFMQLVDNSFNYNVHGRQGFDALASLIEGCECYEFSYSRLGDAAAVFDRLSQELPVRATSSPASLVIDALRHPEALPALRLPDWNVCPHGAPHRSAGPNRRPCASARLARGHPAGTARASSGGTDARIGAAR